MTDIVERLRENAPMGETAVTRNLMYHAADMIEDALAEIERLREEMWRLRNTLKSMEEGTDLQRRDMEAEIFRLRAEAGYD